MPKDLTDIKAKISTYLTGTTRSDQGVVTDIQTKGRFLGEGISGFYDVVVPSGQFARSFCWAHGCDFDSSIKVEYTYEAPAKTTLGDGEVVPTKFGLPVMMYAADGSTPVFGGTAKVCKDFNHSNSTASIMQFGIVLA